MMKGRFWLHLEEGLKCDLIIIKKKKTSSRTQPACPSKSKRLSELHFKGCFFSFAYLQRIGKPGKKARIVLMNAAVIKKKKKRN